MAEKLFCPKCRKTMAEVNFYQYRDGSKCELCKACLTMHINVYKPEETLYWIFEKFDIPYIPHIWKDKIKTEYEKALAKVNASGITGPKAEEAAYNMTKGNQVVFGKYLSTMKIKQHMNKRWADTERLIAEEQEQVEENSRFDIAEVEKMKEAYERGEISEAQYMTYAAINSSVEIEEPTFDYGFSIEQNGGAAAITSDYYPSNEHPFEEIEIPDPAADLIQEDKVYLAMKWGRLYTPQDWVELEQLYNEYDKSFDLHNADLLTGIKQVCKLDLKSNQALDSGDIDSYSKLARASDVLRKSLKLTEAQRKDEKSSVLSCYGQIVAYCEQTTGYIPKIDLSIDRDIVDAVSRNIKEYNQQLIKEDPAVYKQIEEYIKKKEILAEQEQDIIDGKESLTDQELADFNASIEEQKQYDANYAEGGLLEEE